MRCSFCVARFEHFTDTHPTAGFITWHGRATTSWDTMMGLVSSLSPPISIEPTNILTVKRWLLVDRHSTLSMFWNCMGPVLPRLNLLALSVTYLNIYPSWRIRNEGSSTSPFRISGTSLGFEYETGILDHLWPKIRSLIAFAARSSGHCPFIGSRQPHSSFEKR